jgi:hypothetical protein
MIVCCAMHQSFKAVLEFIRKPEWVAAVALLIQAIILGLQAKILRKHGSTMEEHAGIAKAQAATAELIGKALNQQEKILADQTKIMGAQFSFQRRIEAQAAREKVYDSILTLQSSVSLLISKITSPGERYAPRVAEEQMAQAAVKAAILPVQKATITSLHLTEEENEYFTNYTLDLVQILSSDLQGNVGKLREFEVKYKDILPMLLKVAQTPDAKL